MKKVLIYILLFISLITITYSYTNISACGPIGVSGQYKLNKSLSSPGATCITINVANVGIDCQNFNIAGNDAGSTYGFSLPAAADYVNISNCNIRDFNAGIYIVSGSQYSIFRNINGTSNTAGGISYNNCPNCYSSIYNSYFSGNSNGISFWGGGYVTIENTILIGNTNGLSGFSTGGHNIKNVSFINNIDGIEGARFTLSNIYNSYFSGNTNYDIWIDNHFSSITNYFYNNNLSINSSMYIGLATNYGYKTISGTNYLGNWWRTAPNNACPNPDNSNAFFYLNKVYVVCNSQDYKVSNSLDKGVIIKTFDITNATLNYVNPTPINLDTIYSSSFTVNVSVDRYPINCTLRYNGVNYAMTNDKHYCYRTLSSLSVGTFDYNVNTSFFGYKSKLINRTITVDKNFPTYESPTPNDKSKIYKNSLIINVTYNGNIVTNCNLNFNNGTSYSMTDGTTYCYLSLSIPTSLKDFNYNVSYDMDLTSYYLEQRDFTYYQQKIENTIFPSISILSLFISIILSLLLIS